MPRPPRPLLDGGCYHVMARGNNRQFIFAETDAFRYFLDLLGRAKARYPAKLYHSCLMSNQIHLLLEIACGTELPKFMQFVLQGVIFDNLFCLRYTVLQEHGGGG